MSVEVFGDAVEGFVGDNRSIIDTTVEIAIVTAYDFLADDSVKMRDVLARSGIKFITRPVVEIAGFRLSGNELFFVELGATSAYDKWRGIFDLTRTGVEIGAHFVAPFIGDKILENI